jgi:hypothetical protein
LLQPISVSPRIFASTPGLSKDLFSICEEFPANGKEFLPIGRGFLKKAGEFLRKKEDFLKKMEEFS